MSVTVVTSRGAYRLAVDNLIADPGGVISFTATLERSDGIERVAFRGTIDRGLSDALNVDDPAPVIEQRLAAWLTREFEQTREAAFKSIRTEHRPLEVVFDRDHPGPFG
jgi:hypothetical protein